MTTLKHLIYTSADTHGLSDDAVEELLETVRKKNKALNVTGMLVYDGRSFLQVLEGEEDVVNKLYQKISRDNRHSGTVKIIDESIEERMFTDWSMGYAKASVDQLKQIKGMNDFFSAGHCLKDLDDGRAKLVLEGFGKGRWRVTG